MQGDSTKFYEALGARLRDARHNRGLTQAEVAQACGISRPSLANIESGRQSVSVQLLASLADALCIDVSRLVPKPQTIDIISEAVASAGRARSAAERAWMERIISSAEKERKE